MSAQNEGEDYFTALLQRNGGQAISKKSMSGARHVYRA
jgi:hypothetical protein